MMLIGFCQIAILYLHQRHEHADMALTIRSINKTISHLPVSLAKGCGVFYFEARDGGDWFGESIPVANVNQVDMDYWSRRANEAAQEFKASLAE